MVDESYVAFGDEPKGLVAALPELPDNLVIVRSLTKLYALPGLRIGYLLSSPETIRQLSLRQRPWSIATPALRVAEALLQSSDYTDQAIEERLSSLRVEADWLLSQVEQLHGFEPYGESRTHFRLLRLDDGRSAVALKEWLLAEHGLLIRAADTFDFLDQSYLRLAANYRREPNRRLLAALEEWSER